MEQKIQGNENHSSILLKTFTLASVSVLIVINKISIPWLEISIGLFLGSFCFSIIAKMINTEKFYYLLCYVKSIEYKSNAGAIILLFLTLILVPLVYVYINTISIHATQPRVVETLWISPPAYILSDITILDKCRNNTPLRKFDAVGVQDYIETNRGCVLKSKLGTNSVTLDFLFNTPQVGFNQSLFDIKSDVPVSDIMLVSFIVYSHDGFFPSYPFSFVTPKVQHISIQEPNVWQNVAIDLPTPTISRLTIQIQYSQAKGSIYLYRFRLANNPP